jgi:uncharacterized iron-regulated membrane protein
MWRQWVERPERLWVRQLIFQVHFWLGMMASAYVFIMSVSGAVIVFRDELAPIVSVEWVVRLHEQWLIGASGHVLNRLHEQWLIGASGHVLNGMGAVSLLVLSVTGAVIWWPGRAYWRRSLTIEWSARWPRIIWDAHSALGFWFLPFVAMWSVSGLYLAQPRLFDGLLRLDPRDRIVDGFLFALVGFHFGRFNRATEVVWAAIGLVVGVLAVTGIFICCRRVILHKPSNPKHAVQ